MQRVVKMIMRNDQNIYNFLEDFRYATTSQIEALFFKNKSKRYCQKRLQYLTQQGFIKRCKSTINNDFAYYIDKKSYLPQVHHDLIRTEIFIHMNEKYKVVSWSNEKTIEHIRPDAIAFIEDHKMEFPVFIEIHLSNRFDFDKYKGKDFRPLFGMQPRVLICTDRHITPPNMSLLKFKVINFNNMVGLDSLFK